MARKGPDGGVRKAAAAWFARMHSDRRNAEDEQRFGVWLETAPGHRNAYTGLRRSFEWTEIAADHPEVLAMRSAALRRRHSPLRLLTVRPRFAMAAFAAAAALTLVVALGPGDTLIRGFRDPAPAAQQMVEIHETASGSRTNFSLDDGTLVTLTSGSRVRPLYCEVMRRVFLERGEAYFDVMHDARRPFVVFAGDGQITAVGTEFNVYRKNGEVIVTVTEGQVEVATLDPERGVKKIALLNVGEQVSYHKGEISAVRKVDTARVVAWTSGRLTPAGEPFLSVVEEFNRHSRYKLIVNRYDPRLQDIEISGFFSFDRPESLVEYLKAQKLSVYGFKDSRGNVRLRFVPRKRRG